jgi:hypothetical protein
VHFSTRLAEASRLENLPLHSQSAFGLHRPAHAPARSISATSRLLALRGTFPMPLTNWRRTRPGRQVEHGWLLPPWFTAPSALRPSCKPNPSPKLTRYGKRCKPGPRHLVHHRAPGLQRLPPQAACLER